MGFSEAYESTSLFEGGYTDNPKDKGGPTNYGITEAEARENGYTGDMRTLPKALARKIAKTKYWDVLQGDAIDAISPDVMKELYDTGLNCGVGTAAKFLQRGLNVLNHEHTDYPDVVVDGQIGPKTVEAFRMYIAKRREDGEIVMLRVLNALQGAYYVEITEKREQNEEFTFGWFLERVSL